MILDATKKKGKKEKEEEEEKEEKEKEEEKEGAKLGNNIFQPHQLHWSFCWSNCLSVFSIAMFFKLLLDPGGTFFKNETGQYPHVPPWGVYKPDVGQV